MRRHGFTLIEMLVVVAIIGICVAVSIPSFVEARRGSALRESSQTIIMTAKYARSMALLKQVDMALLVDRGGAQIELVSLSQPPGAGEQDKFVEERGARLYATEGEKEDAGYLTDTNELAAAPPPSIKSELVRDLAEGIIIKDLEVLTGSKRSKDVSWIFFNRNGTSSGFKLTIEDSRGSICDIEMDGISGLIKAKMTDAKGKG